MSDSWSSTRPLLHAIERHAGKIKTDAAWVARFMDQLREKPDFETRAYDALVKAEDELRQAYAAVKAAREHYDRLPITASAAAE